MPSSWTNYYTAHTPVSVPGTFTPVLSSLPGSVSEWCHLVHGLIAHRDVAPRLYGLEVPPERRLETETRYVGKILERIVELDPHPLTTRRPPAKRFFGSCRDFALLLCAILRSKQVPARLRCGFATYWVPGTFVDHWVCEYWNPVRRRWLLADPEIGEPERRTFRIAFDTTDIPRDQFITAGRAWQMCRHGAAQADCFGVPEIGIAGLWFVRGNVLRDLAALNRIELLPWDYTEFADRQFQEFSDLDPDEVQLLDRLAGASGADPVPFPRVTELYRDTPQAQVGRSVRSYTIGGPHTVALTRQPSERSE